MLSSKPFFLFMAIGLFTVFCFRLNAQSKISDEHTRHLNDSLLSLYQSKLVSELGYINGREYKPYHYPTQSNPYFKSTIGVGSLYINGTEYPKKKLFYDLFKDLLIVNSDFARFSQVYIQLNKSEVDSFSISIDNDTYMLTNYREQDCLPGLTEGFYQRVYGSKNLEILIKHGAISTTSDAVTIYKYTIKKFLLHNGEYTDISSKNKLLKLFPDQKKLLKQRLKEITSSYKTISHYQLYQLAQYIETL